MKINELSSNGSVMYSQVRELSLKYQVLSKQTAFLAVNKKDNQVLGELKQVNLNNVKQVSSGGSYRKGDIVMMNGRPCMIVSHSTAKTGKHGSAKSMITAVDLTTNAKCDTVISAGSGSSNVCNAFGDVKD